MFTTAGPRPDVPVPNRRRRWEWSFLVLVGLLPLASLAGCMAWVLPGGYLARDARASGVGAALDQALHQGDMAFLADYLSRVPGTRVCFVEEWYSLGSPPWQTYQRTYGRPNLLVPDGDWAIAVLRGSAAPDFAVVGTDRLILSGKLGGFGCADAGRLRFDLTTARRADGPSVLRVSAKP